LLHPFVSYHLLAILAIIVTTALLTQLDEYLSFTIIVLLYLIPVLLCTTNLGLSPGLFSGILAFLVLNYYFIPPYYTFFVHHSQDLLVLGIFFIVVIFTSQLVGRSKYNLEKITAREREATRLYELSVQLGGVKSRQEILEILSNQVLETFHAWHVTTHLSHPAARENAIAHTPSHNYKPNSKPDAVIALQTVNSFLGEMLIWRDGQPFDPNEERTLHTFAAQATLALERVELDQAQTRARLLEESDRMKSALLSSVSHELRTPLAAIKASATSLISGEIEWDSPEREDLLLTIDEEADELNQLVGNLLDMTRIEAGALNPDRHWNELPEIVESAVQRMHRILINHAVQVDLDENLPMLPVDFLQIQRVFTNLISNGVKFAPPGTTIKIQARIRDSQALLLQITNQGPPVPKEQLQRIFDKFHRITDTSKVTGTGLGLSICKGIIEAHGGKIWAENLPDGVGFKFTLPLVWQGKSFSAAEKGAE
jgi:two-component system sensor histidine kinase KdpD